MSDDNPAPAPDSAAVAAPARAPSRWAPRIRRGRLSVSIVWLVPIIAVLVALSMLLKTWQSIGPRVTVQFQTAEGLVAGKTPVKYKDVVIGTVRTIELAVDRSHVVATIELAKGAREFALDDSRYWVVRPRIGTGGVSGFDTILSGAYIAADIGRSDRARTAFVGLEKPPTVVVGRKGKSFTLDAQDLGSLDVGSPVYYRRVQVGEVVDYDLTDDGKGVRIHLFVDAPHDAHVHLGSRFWNAGGLDFSLGTDGFKMDSQSITTVILGGIGFGTSFTGDSRPAPDGHRFTLEKDRTSAAAPFDGLGQYVQMRFDRSMRGMTTASDVELMGLKFGRVVSVSLDREDRGTFPVTVGAIVYPQRFAQLRDKLVGADVGDEAQRNRAFVHALVDNGVRARARTGSLLTGQLVVALDVTPNARKVTLDPQASPLTIPTVAGGLDSIEDRLGAIVARIDRVPFDTIAAKLDDSLGELNRTLQGVNRTLLPGTDRVIVEAERTLVEGQRTLDEGRRALGEVRDTVRAARQGTLDDDSRLQQQLVQTLLEVQRAAQSLRGLTDLLGRHPDTLLRGFPKDRVEQPDVAPMEPAAPSKEAAPR
jgi:paraquat-inducible protein B